MEVFQLQKLLTLFLSPLAFSILLALVGGLLRRRSLVVAAMLWLWLWSTPWTTLRLAAYVEADYPTVPTATLPTADTILILGGALGPGSVHWQTEPNLTDAGDRIFLAAQLFQLHKAPRILFSGGPSAWGSSEADAGGQLLQRLGVPQAAIMLEQDSRTTRENAKLSLPILQKMGARQVLMVTSSWHMKRALKTFELEAVQQGLNIRFLPAPCDPIQLADAQSRLKRWLPNAEALAASHKLFKEVLGSLHSSVTGQP